MRVILILLLVVGGSAWAGWSVLPRDRIAAYLLFAFSGVTFMVLVAAFFGWIG